MTQPVKSSVEEIRERFDQDVERFSRLEVGNTAQIDSVKSLELIAQAVAARTNPGARQLLDIGWGAGNYSLKILEHLHDLDVTLVDLSQPMLDRAADAWHRKHGASFTRFRLISATSNSTSKSSTLPSVERFHHLREESEWHHTFEKSTILWCLVGLFGSTICLITRSPVSRMRCESNMRDISSNGKGRNFAISCFVGLQKRIRLGPSRFN